ncbi:MAG: flavin reductase [Oscillospiraceae bacterium]|nr:flavin reductase [Oscillospiraceae bacterium]
MDFIDREFKIFKLFREGTPLVCAGNMEHYNACTVGWGSMGTFWTQNDDTGNLVTVYLHPARYTTQFFNENDTFTVCFFPESCKKAVMYMGTHSGRNEDKAAAAGLTPVPTGDTVYFKEAKLTLVCRKLYGGQFSKDGIAPEIAEYYKTKPHVYPVDENGQWQPHWMFVGELIDVIEA